MEKQTKDALHRAVLDAAREAQNMRHSAVHHAAQSAMFIDAEAKAFDKYSTLRRDFEKATAAPMPPKGMLFSPYAETEAQEAQEAQEAPEYMLPEVELPMKRMGAYPPVGIAPGFDE